MASELNQILRLEVPIIVRLGRQTVPVREIIALIPGSIIELSKLADEDLDLLVNNKQIGTGAAVKVGENFGIRVTYIGDVRQRIEAMGGKREERVEEDHEAVGSLPGL